MTADTPLARALYTYVEMLDNVVNKSQSTILMRDGLAQIAVRVEELEKKHATSHR